VDEDECSLKITVKVAYHAGLQSDNILVCNSVQEVTLYASCLTYSQDSVSVSSI